MVMARNVSSGSDTVKLKKMLIGLCFSVFFSSAFADIKIGPLGNDVFLRDIAVEISHDHPELSVAKVMYAVALANPTVFSQTGVFMSHPGATLEIPTAQAMRFKISEHQAQRWLVNQVETAPMPSVVINHSPHHFASRSQHGISRRLAALEQQLEHLDQLDQSIAAYHQMQGPVRWQQLSPNQWVSLTAVMQWHVFLMEWLKNHLTDTTFSGLSKLEAWSIHWGGV